MKDPAFVRRMRRKSFPNKPETVLLGMLNNSFPGEWEFVGDGKLVIVGKNPDFAHKTDKRLIELFGDYWHSEQVTGIPEDQHEQERTQLFENEGYQTLIIWEHELKDEERLMEGIRKWVQ
jgi:very-short-patch-repair endonuclease